MKTIDYNGKKLAEVWVIYEVNNSCMDNLATIRDNYEDAQKHFEKRKADLIRHAERKGLSYINDGTCLNIYEKGKIKYSLFRRAERFELTNKK